MEIKERGTNMPTAILGKLTKEVLQKHQKNERIAITELGIEVARVKLLVQLKTAHRPYDHYLFFCRLTPIFLEYLAIEKFILGSQDKQQYLNTLSTFTQVMMRHHSNIPKLLTPKENLKINLLEWLESNPGCQTSRDILKPLFDLIYQSMQTDIVHPYERYKDIKLLAHKLGLDGKVTFQMLNAKVVEVELEGYDASYTFSEIITSIQKFISTHSGDLDQEHNDILLEALESLTLAYRAKHHHLEDDFLLLLKQRYDAGFPIALPSGLYRHSMNYILQRDLIAYVNRGFLATNKTYGSLFYSIQDQRKVSIDFIREIIVGSNAIQAEQRIREIFLEDGIKKQLILEPNIVHHHVGKKQKVGNCTWANVKQLFKSLLILSYQKRYPTTSWETLSDNVNILYKAWSKWDRTDSLTEFCQKYTTADYISETEIALFKRILIKQHNISKPDELERGAFIIKLLGNDCILGFIAEIPQKLHCVPKDFNFDDFLAFIINCNQPCSREIKGTHDLSDDIQEALSLPARFLSFRDSSIQSTDCEEPCNCKNHLAECLAEPPKKRNRSLSATF